MRLLDLLLKSQEEKPTLGIKMVGCFFLMLSGLVGTYSLFQALTSWVGQIDVSCRGSCTILGGAITLTSHFRKK